MKYELTKQQFDLINYFRTKSRFDNTDELRSLYEQLINQYLKKYIDWRCPHCVRSVLQELIKFSENSTIIDESKINTIEQPTKPRKGDK